MRGKGKSPRPKCADCGFPPPQRLCMSPEGKGGKGCPTLTDREGLAKANQAYEDPALHEFARQASKQEAACYANRHQQPYVMQPTKPRILEIIEFARRLGHDQVGLAFCVGLADEAAKVAEIFRAHGLTVHSAACKAGRTPKDEALGLGDEDKIHRGTAEAMCNPVYQARLLEEAGAQMHVVLGLCVGHDSMFFQAATRPATVLAVKDRVTGHNPLAALYTSGSYYARLKHPELCADDPDEPGR